MNQTLTVAFFVIGNLLGAGFFLMPATVAFLGFNLVWSWLIGGAIALIFGTIFGKLYVLFPNSNDISDYFDDIYLKKTVAFLYWIGIVIGNVIVLIMIMKALNVESIPNSLFISAILLFILFVGNYFFTSDDIIFIESSISALKFLLLLFIPLLVFFSDMSKINIPQSGGNLKDIVDVSILSFWSFMGIETAGVFGNGKAARNGLFLGIIACLLLYLSSCLLIVGIVPLNLLINCKEIPLISLVKFSRFSSLAPYIKYLIVFTSLASLYGWFATSSKIALSFAKNEIFPSVFLQKTKANASFYGLLASFILTFLAFSFVIIFHANQQFEIIADFCVSISLIIFALCANVLYMKSTSLFDCLLSLVAIIFVLFLFSSSFWSSMFYVSIFIACYYIFKFFK